jgi:hypothetical protein
MLNFILKEKLTNKTLSRFKVNSKSHKIAGFLG